MRKLSLTLAVLFPQIALAQLSPQATWATHAANEYQIFPNITYSVNPGLFIRSVISGTHTGLSRGILQQECACLVSSSTK